MRFRVVIVNDFQGGGTVGYGVRDSRTGKLRSPCNSYQQAAMLANRLNGVS